MPAERGAEGTRRAVADAFGDVGQPDVVPAEQFLCDRHTVDPSSPRWGAQPRTSAFERGRYTASTVCAECHAPSFEGDPIDGGPSLRIVGAYDLPAFRHLLRTGVPVGGPRDIGIMGRVSRDAFAQFRDDEIDDLYVFLRSRAGLP